MRTKITLFLLLTFQFLFCQIESRKPLHGRVINDSIPAENVFVLNLSSKTRTFVGKNGFFDLLASPKDTIVFSSLTFKPRKIILTEKECALSLLEIRLETYTNELDEVVVSKKITIDPHLGDIQAIIDKPYFDDFKSSPINRTMPSNGTIENGINFIRLFGGIVKLFKKTDAKKKKIETPPDFIKEVKKSIKPTFFSKTLKIKETDIGLFLQFCENDSKATTLLKPEFQFQLLDFLVTKAEEFKRIAIFEK